MKSKQPQFYGASTKAYKRARSLRRRETEAEAVLWNILRNRKIAKHKFRRQHPIGPFYADFYCHEALLVIEVDGKIHDRVDVREYDIQRQEYIESLGITVLRFSNESVLEQPAAVVEEVRRFLDQLS